MRWFIFIGVLCSNYTLTLYNGIGFMDMFDIVMMWVEVLLSALLCS